MTSVLLYRSLLRGGQRYTASPPTTPPTPPAKVEPSKLLVISPPIDYCQINRINENPKSPLDVILRLFGSRASLGSTSPASPGLPLDRPTNISAVYFWPRSISRGAQNGREPVFKALLCRERRVWPRRPLSSFITSLSRRAAPTLNLIKQPLIPQRKKKKKKRSRTQ